MADSTLGKFTANVPRRTQKGPPTISRNEHSATDEYTVWVPDGNHPFEAGVSGIPEPGDTWDIDSDYKCERVTWQNEFPSEIWTAQVQYKIPKNNTNAPTDQPESIPSGVILKKISYSPTSWNMDCEYDAGNGAPVQNTVADRFQDALTTQIYTTSITIDTKENKVPIDDIALQGTINEASAKIGGVSIQKHCGLFTIDVREGDDDDYPFEVHRNIQVATNPLPKGGTASANWIVTEYGTKVSVDNYGREDLGYDACVLNTGYRHYEDIAPPSGGFAKVVKSRFVDTEIDIEGNEAKRLAVDPHMLDEMGYPAEELQNYWVVFQRYREAQWPAWFPKGAPTGHTEA